MNRLFLFVLSVSVAVAGLGSRNLLIRAGLPGDPVASQAGNAAFRDGLHLGGFDAASGRSQHLSVGRWSSQANRASFTAGYQAGYQQANAKNIAGE